MRGAPLLREFMRQHRMAVRSFTVDSKTCGKKRLKPVKIGEDSITVEERIMVQLASCKQMVKREREKRSSSSSDSSVPIDRYGRFHNYLRVSLTERCNLRCTYCMPSEGIKLTPDDELLTTEEIVHLLKLFAKVGINKVRFTGGEPLLRKDLLELVRKTKEIGIDHIGITTNAITLSRQLEDLATAGLSHINVSLDTLDGNSFKLITRRNGLSMVQKGIQAAMDAGYAGEGRLKINCVVMRGVNDHTIADFLDLARQGPIDVRFIEWMPFNGNKWADSRFLGYREMLKRLEGEQLEALGNTCPNDTTKWYKGPHLIGRVGFITSMSEHFCGGCNRLRLTSDGRLKVCLFGDESLSLRDALRIGIPDNDLLVLVNAAVMKKEFAHGGYDDMYAIASGSSTNRPMISIGG